MLYELVQDLYILFKKSEKGVQYRAPFVIYLIMGISKRRKTEYMQSLLIDYSGIKIFFMSIMML